ncbi:hypothetical protein Nepgr_009232 [Nepenthes gracilis]|uniref:protein-serine/threonine phosphatase n=1 Tax=Nepenthes gracilis TaxID=150966 RepID=A0AAD3XJZ1_NEPGR|nr:hypothetical protein Nepgr_009232 [Nepenthes gracilis]
MAEFYSGVVSDREGSSSTASGTAGKRSMAIRRFKFVAGVATTDSDDDVKCQKVDVSPTSSFPRECESTVGSCGSEDEETILGRESEIREKNEVTIFQPQVPSDNVGLSPSTLLLNIDSLNVVPKFGVSSVCGRRRDMEDAVAVHPSFCRRQSDAVAELHYFGVYDGHGCSHVAMKCRDRLHELVKEELLLNKAGSPEWKETMDRSFNRMDNEVVGWNEGDLGGCRCELQTRQCDAVGSTAVVAIVTPVEIIVANCGDSRAVLCRKGKPVPLSSDHKPDRPDELNRIQEAGGRVMYWNGPRVLGVLAMSRAIGDDYLKPYVSCEPEVTVTDRTSDDDCLILASDGLWDVVSNGTACGVALKCLSGKGPPRSIASSSALDVDVAGGVADRACSDASALLMKLALARHSTDNVSVVVIDLRN